MFDAMFEMPEYWLNEPCGDEEFDEYGDYETEPPEGWDDDAILIPVDTDLF
jgi:hypothetical protein